MSGLGHFGLSRVALRVGLVLALALPVSCSQSVAPMDWLPQASASDFGSSSLSGESNLEFISGLRLTAAEVVEPSGESAAPDLTELKHFISENYSEIFSSAVVFCGFSLFCLAGLLGRVVVS